MTNVAATQGVANLETATELEAKLRQLEKENRLLKRKLARSERMCEELEDTNDKKEALLRRIIQELRESQASVEEREQRLQALQAAQAQLVQTEKMSSLGQLVAGIAHEMNNPVNFISGNMDYVEEYAQELMQIVQRYQQAFPTIPPDLQTYLEAVELEFLLTDFTDVITSVKSGAKRIREIVVSLRNFARLDEAAQKVVDIHEGINSTLQILTHRLKGNKKRPEIQVIKNYADLPLINCYPGQLNQVFMNLLVNAIDACEETEPNSTANARGDQPHQIQIHTQNINNHCIQITITDNGMGIPETARSRLFEPFFTTKPVGKGTGMGLAISYQIITERHQGRLDFHSEVGQGTTFVIELPLGVKS
ncbi:MAG: ATP-binding protein [Cyanobacteria bacterium P01_G01_bin.54]